MSKYVRITKSNGCKVEGRLVREPTLNSPQFMLVNGKNQSYAVHVDDVRKIVEVR